MIRQPAEVDAEHYHDEWAWAYLERELELEVDERYEIVDYPTGMTNALAEVFTALQSWAIPLAVSVGFSPTGTHFDPSTPSLMILSTELSNEVNLDESWRTRAVPARPVQVDTITGEEIRNQIRHQLDKLAQEHNKPFHVDGLRIRACRFAIGPASMPEEFTLSSWGGTDLREVKTVAINGKRWIREPQVENEIMLPVQIRISGLEKGDYQLRLSLSPSWSYYGDKDEPGWPMIVDTTERLQAQSKDWKITRLEPGDPARR